MANVCRDPEVWLTAKNPSADCLFVVRALPRVTLAKPFAEGKPAFALCIWHLTNLGFSVVYVGGVSENPDMIPEHESGKYANVQVRVTVDAKGEKESPKDCSCLKSCDPFYTCPRAPFYRETKGLLHSESTLESKKYSKCEHVHECLLHPIHLQACH
jgi:hypothetical protein